MSGSGCTATMATHSGGGGGSGGGSSSRKFSDKIKAMQNEQAKQTEEFERVMADSKAIHGKRDSQPVHVSCLDFGSYVLSAFCYICNRMGHVARPLKYDPYNVPVSW